MKKSLEVSWVGLHIGMGGVSGIYRGGATSVSQVTRDPDMMTTCIACCKGEEFIKGKWILPVFVSERKLPFQHSP